jgi:hypothetical protein
MSVRKDLERPLDERERRGYEQAMADRCELTRHDYEDGLTPDFARTQICRWCGKRLVITKGIFG